LTRYLRRARTSERGFVLVAALVLAILYFSLMELMLLDSSRALRESQRYRARVVAAVLAENGAELAAEEILTNPRTMPVELNGEDGTMRGALSRQDDGKFVITGEGKATGVASQQATVELQGQWKDPVSGDEKVKILYSTHSQ
jgi:hypothetical protein